MCSSDLPSRPQYLDESAHEVPAIALGNAAREALRIADMTQSLLGMARAGFLRDNRHRIAPARYVNNAIDRLDGAITTYLATLDQDAMNQIGRASGRERVVQYGQITGVAV